MAANYCPCCVHCQTLKELEENAVKVNKRRQDFEEEQRPMEEELEAKRRRVIEEGVIYGDRYDCYTVQDIQKITDMNFLNEMLNKMIPCGQPQTEEEIADLTERYDAAAYRFDELVIENLE